MEQTNKHPKLKKTKKKSLKKPVLDQTTGKQTTKSAPTVVKRVKPDKPASKPPTKKHVKHAAKVVKKAKPSAKVADGANGVSANHERGAKPSKKVHKVLHPQQSEPANQPIPGPQVSADPLPPPSVVPVLTEDKQPDSPAVVAQEEEQAIKPGTSGPPEAPAPCSPPPVVSDIQQALVGVASFLPALREPAQPTEVEEEVDYDDGLVEEEEEVEFTPRELRERREALPSPVRRLTHTVPISLPPPPPPVAQHPPTPPPPPQRPIAPVSAEPPKDTRPQRLLTVAIPKRRALQRDESRSRGRARSPDRSKSKSKSRSRSRSRDRRQENLPPVQNGASVSPQPHRFSQRSRKAAHHSRSPPKPFDPTDSPRTKRDKARRAAERELVRRPAWSPPPRRQRRRAFSPPSFHPAAPPPPPPPRMPHAMPTSDVCTPRYTRQILRDQSFSGPAGKGELVDRVPSEAIVPMDLQTAKMPLIIDGYLFSIGFADSYGAFNFAQWGDYKRFPITFDFVNAFRFPPAERLPVPGPMDPPLEHPDFVFGEAHGISKHPARTGFVYRFIYGAQMLRATCVVMRGLQFARMLYEHSPDTPLPCSKRCGNAMACFAKWTTVRKKDEESFKTVPGATEASVTEALESIYHAKQALGTVLEFEELGVRSYCLYNISRLLFCPCAEW